MDQVDLIARCKRYVEAFEPQQFGFMEGAVGQTVAAFELARADPTTDASPWLEALVERFNETGAGPGLHSGVAGMGLAISMYVAGADDMLEMIDRAILPHLDRLPPTSLRVGWAGQGSHFTRARGPRRSQACFYRTSWSSVSRVPQSRRPAERPGMFLPHTCAPAASRVMLPRGSSFAGSVSWA